MRVQKTLLLLHVLLNSAPVLAILQSPSEDVTSQCTGYDIDFSRLKKLSSRDVDMLIGGHFLHRAHTYSRSKVHTIVPETTEKDLRSACLGSRHRLQEMVQGVPVYGADILVDMDTCLTQDTDYHAVTSDWNFLTSLARSGESIKRLKGTSFGFINVPEGYTPSKTKDQVIEAIATSLNIDKNAVGDPALEVFVSTGGDFLAYRSYSIVENSETTDLVELVVDAHTGNVLSRCSLAGDTSGSYRQRMLRSSGSDHERQLFNCKSCADQTAPVVWTGPTTSCSLNSLYLDDTVQETLCYKGINLNDNTKVVGPGPVDAIHWDGTLDCNGGTDCSPVVLPTCRDAISDIQFAGVTSFMYLRNHLGIRGGLNRDGGRPIRMKAYAHYQDNYCNAFYSPSSDSVYFGDCNCHTWSPLAAVDIVGHEIYHGVTRHSSGLVYSGQSGGLNEAYSDIFGTVIEFFVDDYSDPPDFTIAEQVGAVLRNMEAPLTRSITSICDYFTGMNVHYSSGAVNKAYVKAVRACESNGCGGKLQRCAVVVGTAFLYSGINGLTSTSDFLDAAATSCDMVDEYFSVHRPAIGCSASQVRNFIKIGWSEVGVAFSASKCVAFSTCPGAPQPTVPPPTTPQPTAPQPTAESETAPTTSVEGPPLPTPVLPVLTLDPTPQPTQKRSKPAPEEDDEELEEKGGILAFLGNLCSFRGDNKERSSHNEDDSWWPW